MQRAVYVVSIKFNALITIYKVSIFFALFPIPEKKKTFNAFFHMLSGIKNLQGEKKVEEKSPRLRICVKGKYIAPFCFPVTAVKKFLESPYKM